MTRKNSCMKKNIKIVVILGIAIIAVMFLLKYTLNNHQVDCKIIKNVQDENLSNEAKSWLNNNNEKKGTFIYYYLNEQSEQILLDYTEQMNLNKYSKMAIRCEYKNNKLNIYISTEDAISDLEVSNRISAIISLPDRIDDLKVYINHFEVEYSKESSNVKIKN